MADQKPGSGPRGDKGRRPPQTYGVKVETLGPKELGPAEARVPFNENVVGALRALAGIKETVTRLPPDEARKVVAELKRELKEIEARTLREVKAEDKPFNISMVGGRRTRMRRSRNKKVTRGRRRHH